MRLLLPAARGVVLAIVCAGVLACSDATGPTPRPTAPLSVDPPDLALTPIDETPAGPPIAEFTLRVNSPDGNSALAADTVVLLWAPGEVDGPVVLEFTSHIRALRNDQATWWTAPVTDIVAYSAILSYEISHPVLRMPAGMSALQ